MSSTSPSVHPSRSRNVTAVLGPTNTGKTHLAIERMLGHQTGMIGLPLRLLAREVYDKIVARVGADAVALITGEEKIKPASPRFYVSTVESMPRDARVSLNVRRAASYRLSVSQRVLSASKMTHGPIIIVQGQVACQFS